MGRKPATDSPAARRSASTSCQAALGWPEPAGQPVRHRLVPAHEGAHQPVVLAQLGQGLPVVTGREGGITAQPRERGAQERDPRGDIGQHAIALRRSEGPLIRFVAADRERRARRHRAGPRVLPPGSPGRRRTPGPGTGADGRGPTPPAAPKASGAGSRPRCGRAASSTCRSTSRAAQAASPAASACRTASSARSCSSHQAAAARCSACTRPGCSACSRARSRSANRWW